MIDRAKTWNTTSADYLMLQNGQMVRAKPKLKGKAAVKAHRKARRKAWRQLQDMKRLALAYPDSEVARHMANAEAQFGVAGQGIGHACRALAHLAGVVCGRLRGAGAITGKPAVA